MLILTDIFARKNHILSAALKYKRDTKFALRVNMAAFFLGGSVLYAHFYDMRPGDSG